jgi:hypothetical protein
MTDQIVSQQESQDKQGLINFFAALLETMPYTPDEGRDMDPDGSLTRELHEAISKADPSVVMGRLRTSFAHFFKCEGCGGEVPATELPDALTNGGLCGECWQRHLNKIRKEK